MTLPLFQDSSLRVVVTANRNLSLCDVRTIEDRAADLCTLELDEVIFGGARGGDTQALMAISSRRDPSRTRLVVVVPCRLDDQPFEAQEAVRRCLQPGDELVELRQAITSADGFEAFKARNRHMVSRGTHCLGFWDGDRRSGTWSCLSYAMRMGLPTWAEKIKGGDRRHPTSANTTGNDGESSR